MAKKHLVIAKFTKNQESPRRVKVYTAWRLENFKFVKKEISYPVGANEVSLNFYLDPDIDTDDHGFLDLIYLDFNVFNNVPSGHKIYVRSWEKSGGNYMSNDEDYVLTGNIEEGD